MSGWLQSARYDLCWFFAGAAASLAIPIAIGCDRALLVPLFWIWLVTCDGTHLWATYSRTYLDAAFWRERRGLLIGSLALFLAPAAAVAAWTVSGDRRVLDLFLLGAQAWAWHHVVRQHYGFVSLYDRRAAVDAGSHRIRRWGLQLGLWALYLLFVATHPVNRRLLGLPPWSGERIADVVVAGLCVAVAGVSLFAIAAAHARAAARDESRSLPAAAFAALCLATYAAIFSAVAPHEPFYAQPRSTIEHFLVVGMAMSVFHNIQYHGIVRLHHRRTYGPGRGHGPADVANAGVWRYAAAGLGFAALYAFAAWRTTDYPPLAGEPLPHAVAPAAFCVLWGLLLHHYYLDQRIWRPSEQPDLRRTLIGAAA